MGQRPPEALSEMIKPRFVGVKEQLRVPFQVCDSQQIKRHEPRTTVLRGR